MIDKNFTFKCNSDILCTVQVNHILHVNQKYTYQEWNIGFQTSFSAASSYT